ncbi:MAG: Zn-dependent oligopeptidase, partial [Aquabacterium sp.]|nr:Zn-dependent oligopeptidase [Aquabacterium sp.]
PAISTPKVLAAMCQRNLAQANAGLQLLRRHPANGGWLRAQDTYMARVEDWAYRLLFLAQVHPDKAVRAAAEACELRWNSFFSSLGQDAALHRAARQLQPADETDRQLLANLLRDFDDAGVGLPPAQRTRARRLNDRIAELGQQFERNIRDANLRVAFSSAELHGVPEAVWKDAKRDAGGRLLLGVEAPTYSPVLQLAESPAARERMWRAKLGEGGAANLKLLAEITRLRKDYAQLFGAASWAGFVTRRRMAESPAKAEAFLAEVKAAVQARELKEIEELRQAKASHLGQALDQVTLHRWDVPFYTERVRQARFAVDQEAFRQYFPPQESLQFTLRLIERLMGVRYQRVEGATAWHPEVQTYAVSDAATGAPLGSMWVDLYPREGKYNHAAVWGLRSVSGDLKRQPQAALVVNFNRKGLTLDEMETLLHELGHAVHNNLSTTRHVQQAGTNVLRDFVEAPSQMLEDWVYDKRVLALMAEVCPACKPVPDALLDQAVSARRFGKGMQQSRQHLFASYDLALYGPSPREPMALWAQMEGTTPLGHVAGTMFPAGFAHIAGGYSAGYYSYLWSEVVSSDMRTAFAADKLDARVGRRYRDTVLAQGSQRPPQQLVRDFLGRDFNARAFFDELAR